MTQNNGTHSNACLTRLENKINALAFELIQTNQDLIEIFDLVTPTDYEKRATVTSRIGRIRTLSFVKRE